VRISILIFLVLLDRVFKFIFFGSEARFSDDAVAKGVLIFISTVIITLLAIRYKFHLSRYWYPMLLIGGASNLFDLIVYGRVIDYIPLFNYILNFSDIIVSIGIVILVIDIYKYENNNR
jgi:lipoprotein signal peptidase